MWRLEAYWRLARFDRPAGLLLLLWPTLWGVWAASRGVPDGRWVAVFAGGVAVMRAFGCVVNDMVDARLDAGVARTAGRPLACGRVSRAEAAGVAAVLAAAALGLWALLPGAARGWALAAGGLAVGYPFCKRFMALPQVGLGVAFGFGILVADVAVRGAATPSAAAWGLFVGNFLWVMAYDTVYAMADREGDAAHGGVGSAALFFGRRDVAAVSMLYAACLVWLSGVGVVFGYGVAFQVALMACAGCVFRFWQKYRSRRADACLAVFRANHWVGVFVLAGVGAAHFG